MTTEIRKEIKNILPTQRAQHDRIKDALVMICDEIDTIKSIIMNDSVPTDDKDDNLGKLKGATDRLSKLQEEVKGKKK
jgi:hypothetical protein